MEMTVEPHNVQFNYYFTDTPQYWTNFVRSLPLVKSSTEYWNQINRALTEYNAVLSNIDNEPIISFASEADYIHFLLKWT